MTGALFISDDHVDDIVIIVISHVIVISTIAGCRLKAPPRTTSNSASDVLLIPTIKAFLREKIRLLISFVLTRFNCT